MTVGLADDVDDVTTLPTLPTPGPLLVEAARGALADLVDGSALDRLPGRGLLGGARPRRRREDHDDDHALGPPGARSAPESPGAGAAAGDVVDGGDDATPSLPARAVRVRSVEVSVDAVADYARVCGFRLDTRVPVTWPHLLGFPLGLWLMTRGDFPHPVVGLVHVRNRIHAHDHVEVGDHLDVAATVADQRPHAKGIQFDVAVDVTRGDEVVWASTSTYLRRGPSPGGHVPEDRAPVVAASDLPMTGRWSLDGDLGRRYASVSGDGNPIHLFAATARAFRFPRAIAHGMWTKAAALAGLGTLPRPVDIDVAFRRPVLLPSRPTYATRRTAKGWQFALRRDDEAPHLVGAAT